MQLPKPYFSVPETCAILQICKATLYKLIKQKKIKPKKVCNRTFFTPNELDRFTKDDHKDNNER